MNENANKETLIRLLLANQQGTIWETIRLLESNGWLSDGTLKGIDLSGLNFAMASWRGANLENAQFIGSMLLESQFEGSILNGANFTNANLFGAMMCDAEMIKVNFDYALAIGACIGGTLQGSSFRNCNLEAAILGGNLQLALFTGANLARASVINADMRGANLVNANLSGAIFKHINWDASTILPDGTQWKIEIDLDKFTNI